MQVKDLIEMLSECDPELNVYAWIDGEIYKFGMVDELGDRVDINVIYQGDQQ